MDWKMKNTAFEQLYYRKIVIKNVPWIDYIKIDNEHKTMTVSRQVYFSLLLNQKARHISSMRYERIKNEHLKRGYVLQGPIDFDYFILEVDVRKALRMEDPKERLVLLSRRSLQQAYYYDPKLVEHVLDTLSEGNITIMYFTFWAKLYNLALNSSPVVSKKERKCFSLMIQALTNLVIAILNADGQENIRHLIAVAKLEIHLLDVRVEKIHKRRKSKC